MPDITGQSTEEVLKGIASRQSGVLADLVELANMNSGSDNLEGIGRCFDFLEGKLGKLADRVERLELPGGKEALRGFKREGAGVRLLFNGHVDTVYGLESGFQECRVEGNKLHGPGVADMKGGLMVMLSALEGFEGSGEFGDVGWEVLITPDEEIGSESSLAVMKEAADRSTMGLIFEPSLPDGSLVRTRMGTAHLNIEVKGKAAHVGRDFLKGKNAVTHMAGLVLELERLNEAFPDAIINVGSFEGEGLSNVVPEKAKCLVGVRYRGDRGVLEKAIEVILDKGATRPGFEVAYDLHFYKGPKELTPAIEWMFEGYRDAAQVMGVAVDWKDTGGASDGNSFAGWGLPNIDNFGVRGDHIHSDAEFMYVDSLTERAGMMCLFLMKLARGQLELPEKLFNRYG